RQRHVVCELARDVQPRLYWTIMEQGVGPASPGHGIVLVLALKVGLHLIIRDARPPNDGGGGQEIRQRGEGERRPGSSPRPGQDILHIVPQTEATSGGGRRGGGGPSRARP